MTDTTSIKEFAIPLLPCRSIHETLAFYQALGFEVTYRQQMPNTYACIKIRELELHFFVIKALKSEANFSSCYLVVKNIDDLYQSFQAGLKKQFGKIPVKGFPRLNPLKDMPTYGVRQFIVVDPSGNYIRIGQPIRQTDSLIFKENNTDAVPAKGTPLEIAYELGSRLADGKGDFETAAKVLDKALTADNYARDIHLFRIFLLRADMAIRSEDQEVARRFLNEADTFKERESVKISKEDMRLWEELHAQIRTF